MMISPTQLIIRSLGMQPEGTERAEVAGRCVMCGGDYSAGELVEPFSPKDSFTEYSDLQNPSGTHICGACKATWRKEFMQNYTKSVVCEGGLYPFFSNDAVGYWILNPPPPPYLMFISTQQLGHIVWKAPVNLSRDLMLVRYNDKVLKIRRDHLLKCVTAVRLLSDLLLKDAKPGRGRKPTTGVFKNPLILDRSLEREVHGRLRDEVRALPTRYPESQDAIDTLDSATVGETWALAHVLYATDPVKPEAKVAFGQFNQT
jgi:CRISPR type IV-associated protein Csf1